MERDNELQAGDRKEIRLRELPTTWIADLDQLQRLQGERANLMLTLAAFFLAVAIALAATGNLQFNSAGMALAGSVFFGWLYITTRGPNLKSRMIQLLQTASPKNRSVEIITIGTGKYQKQALLLDGVDTRIIHWQLGLHRITSVGPISVDVYEDDSAGVTALVGENGLVLVRTRPRGQ